MQGNPYVIYTEDQGSRIGMYVTQNGEKLYLVPITAVTGNVQGEEIVAALTSSISDQNPYLWTRDNVSTRITSATPVTMV